MMMCFWEEHLQIEGDLLKLAHLNKLTSKLVQEEILHLVILEEHLHPESQDEEVSQVSYLIGVIMSISQFWHIEFSILCYVCDQSTVA